MNSEQQQSHSIPEKQRENLHYLEELCRKVEELPEHNQGDIQAEIGALEANFAAAKDSVAPEYSELLQQRFDNAKNKVNAAIEEIKKLHAETLALRKELDALIAAGELATAKECEKLEKKFEAFRARLPLMPTELADFEAKIAPLRQKFAEEAKKIAEKAAVIGALCEEFGALVKEQNFEELHKRKNEFDTRVNELGNLNPSEKKRTQDLRRQIGTLLATHYQTLDFARWESYTLKLDVIKKLEKLLELPQVEIFKAAKPLVALRAEWKELGSVPHEKNEEVNAKFLEQTRELQHRIDEFFSMKRQEQKQALADKTALVEEAKKFAEHKRWNEGTTAFKELQQKWKSLPHCGEKEQELYMAFRACADQFFAARNAYFAERDAQVKNAVDAKNALIEEAEKITSPREATGLRERFRNTPFAGKQEHELYEKFNATLEKFFTELKAADIAREEQSKKLVAELEAMAESPSGIEKRMEEIRAELKQLACRGTFDLERRAWAKLEKAIERNRRSAGEKKFGNYQRLALALAQAIDANSPETAPTEEELRDFPKLQQDAALFVSQTPENLTRLANRRKNAESIFGEIWKKCGFGQKEAAPLSLAAELEAAIMGNSGKNSDKTAKAQIDFVKFMSEVTSCGTFTADAMKKYFDEFNEEKNR